VGHRFQKVIAALAVVLGVGAVLAGASVFVEAWQTSQVWAGSAEAQHAAVPSEAPIWLDEVVPPPAVDPWPVVSQPPIRQAAAPQPVVTSSPLRAPDRDETGVAAREPAPDPPSLAAPPIMAAPAEVEVADIDFRFLDPPEPGAHARLAVSLVNRASAPTGPLSVIVPARWLQDFTVFGAIPDVLDDRAYGDGERQFVFDGLGPGERKTVELHVLAAGEEIEAPEVRIVLGSDAEIGRARPRTVAPRPRPGPARAVTIPKLGVRAAVVPVPWEPPPFVVGQLQGTAAVPEGNTVLIGHLAGPAGDVFARLDRLRPGDEVVAISRGLEYRFVVSEIAVKPHDDVVLTQPTTTPRLTLMTCTGQWSMVRQDYSHRLWVVAEPPELAQQTIRANAERAAQAAIEAETAAAARATHEAEAGATLPAPDAAPSEVPPPASTLPVRIGPDASVPASTERPPPGPDAGSASAVAVAAPGILIDGPVDGHVVGRRLTVRGRLTAEADRRVPLWLLVRAEIEGSRWYALDRPLQPDKDGAWQVDVELGGPAGIRHEVRVGPVDVAADGELRRHAAARPGQPLDDLPAGFTMGARVVVERR